MDGGESFVENTSTTLNKRPRGRPPGKSAKKTTNEVTPDDNNRKRNKSNCQSYEPVGWSQYPISLFSLTITKKKDDVPSTLLSTINSWAVEHCTKAAFATEVGTRAFKLHIQGVFECHFPKTTDYMKLLGLILYLLFI